MISITTVSWSDLQRAAGEAGFDPVPAGPYDVIVDSASVKAATNGKNMIACKFKIESGPAAGRVVYNQFVISPDNENALAFFFRHMSALGLTDEYFSSNPTLERVAADLIGRRCVVQVSIRQWQGTDRNQVDAVAPPAGGPVTPPVMSGLPGIPAAGPAPVVPGVPAVPTASAPAAPPTPSAPPVPPAPPVPSSPSASPVPTSPPPAASGAVVTSAAPPSPPGMGSADELPF